MKKNFNKAYINNLQSKNLNLTYEMLRKDNYGIKR